MGSLAAVLAIVAGASEPRLCDGGVYDQFDFWLGEWAIEQSVHQPDGSIEKYPARTEVVRSSDGCVITEHWRGTTRLFWYGMEQPEALWGYSVRRVDSITGEWLINWIDAKSPRFTQPFAGKFESNEGTFYQITANRRGRIRFVQSPEGTVYWDLAVSPLDTERWKILWEMEMRPVQSPAAVD